MPPEQNKTKTESSSNSGISIRNVAAAAGIAVGALGTSAPGLTPLPVERPAPAVASPSEGYELTPTVPLVVATQNTEAPTPLLVDEVLDSSTHPIRTQWEEDFQPDSELAQEIHSAIGDCFAEINQRRSEGALLTGVRIGGLSSGEDNVTNPGDPMANLDKPSQNPDPKDDDNLSLANKRGLTGLKAAKEDAPSYQIPQEIIQLSEAKEVDPTPEELSQITGYATLLGLSPLELIQQYNRDIQGGLQPLMDKVFEGNRGIICTASYTKEVVSQTEDFQVILVPLENDQKREIEVPNGVLVRPLLYIAYVLSQQPVIDSTPSASSIRPPKEIGQAQSGHFQNNQRIKQPNIKTNFHNTGQRGHRSNHVRPTNSTTFSS